MKKRNYNWRVTPLIRRCELKKKNKLVITDKRYDNEIRITTYSNTGKNNIWVPEFSHVCPEYPESEMCPKCGSTFLQEELETHKCDSVKIFENKLLKDINQTYWEYWDDEYTAIFE